MIEVCVRDQLLVHHWHGVRYRYPVSTARRGVGNIRNSEQTPLGRHRIAARIGSGMPIMTSYRGRQAVGIYRPNVDGLDNDWILSRILWLAGEQAGINRYGKVDTFQRYIYIHGTADETGLGSPISHGCIRMSNHDIITLFDRTCMNERVIIRT